MTSALHAEGPRFDPGWVYDSVSIASIAQMVERKTLNLVVVGSIPTGGAFAGSSPGWASSAHRALGSHQSAALAQLGERQTEDLKVPGSIPGGGIFAADSSPCGLMAKARPS